MKSSAYLKEVFLDPKLSFSQEPTDTPFNAAFRTKLSLWDWFDLKEHNYQRIRFGIAMEGSKRTASQTAILEGMGMAIEPCELFN